MTDRFELLRDEIMQHSANKLFTDNGLKPLFAGSVAAKIVIIGQAPGSRAQASGKPWDDASGIRLMQWLGVNEATFRDPSIFAHMPMDFYYPGKGKSGDLPPRKDFAMLWHAKLLEMMPNLELTVLVGNYAQRHYLPDAKKMTLTQTVQNYADYLPEYFPIVHPSPLNFRWLTQHPWFELEVVPELHKCVADVLVSDNEL